MNSSSSSASGWFGKVSELVSNIIGIEKLSQINPIAFIIYLLMYITAIGFICLALLFFTATTDKIIDNFNDLDKELEKAKSRNELSFIEVKCSISARGDLGRPTTTALENKENFMEYIENLK